MPAVAQRVADSAAVHPRKIVARTRGRRNGPAVRLMSPSDFGQFLKPFVFLDFFDIQGPPFVGALHPRSDIATLSYLIDGRMDLIDSRGQHRRVAQRRRRVDAGRARHVARRQRG